jgi:chorismate mutase
MFLKVTLDTIRERIDFLDKALLLMINQRLALMPLVTQIKKEQNIPIYQQGREKRIYENLEKFAKDHELEEEFLKELFRLIITECKNVENHLLNKEDKMFEGLHLQEEDALQVGLFKEALSKISEFNGLMESIEKNFRTSGKQATAFEWMVFLTEREIGGND